ncbi:hypothetical protein Taro_045182, partial [Colocasia esculenta]|nr:hypothetical protein [Colocasia esculenta]
MLPLTKDLDGTHVAVNLLSAEVQTERNTQGKMEVPGHEKIMTQASVGPQGSLISKLMSLVAIPFHLESRQWLCKGRNDWRTQSALQAPEEKVTVVSTLTVDQAIKGLTSSEAAIPSSHPSIPSKRKWESRPSSGESSEVLKEEQIEKKSSSRRRKNCARSRSENRASWIEGVFYDPSKLGPKGSLISKLMSLVAIPFHLESRQWLCKARNDWRTQ